MNEMIASLLASLTSAHEKIGALRVELSKQDSHDSNESTYMGYNAEYWHTEYTRMKDEAERLQSDAYALDNTLASFNLKLGDLPGPNWDCHNRSHTTSGKDLGKSIRELLCFARDARKGNTIDAIKRVRVLTGLGLKESKDLVEEFLTLFPKS